MKFTYEEFPHVAFRFHGFPFVEVNFQMSESVSFTGTQVTKSDIKCCHRNIFSLIN